MVIEQYIEIYKKYIKELDIHQVEKAIRFAVKYHGSQKRASGELYYFHPLEVAKIIAELSLDSDSVITAILHDTVEDTDLTLAEIEDHFGKHIALLVDGVTKLTKCTFNTENAKQAENFRKLLMAMSNDIRVLLVKLADRLHNMRTLHFVKSMYKRKRIALETMEIYANLAERIGIQKFKTELQDICFDILYPKERKFILHRFDTIKGKSQDLVYKISDRIKHHLLENHMQNYEVQGREKTPYSTWMKMKQKNIQVIDQLSDIVAFRIIVDNITDCYKALGIIHSTYKMIHENFQDFISTPKNNGYQSIHTIVIGPFMQKIEIQIRTKKMHEIAEFGIAAHWQYKQKHKDLIEGQKYSWVRELISIVNQDNNPEEILKNTKLAMYYNQVFCFAKNGSVISLPKGSTVLDFAYIIHKNLGNYCLSATVNRSIVSLNTPLKNGDQVEIITSDKKTVSSAWENFVVTGKARSEIHKFIKSQHYTQHAKLGSSILDAELNYIKGIEKDDYDAHKMLHQLRKTFNTQEQDLYFAIGNGTIDILELRTELRNFCFNKQRSNFSFFNFMRNGKNTSAPKECISIKDLIPGIAMHFAKCCHPILGDKIVGIVYPHHGMIVHIADCIKIKNIKNQEQIMNLSWTQDMQTMPCIHRLQIEISHKSSSSLAKVTSIISKYNGNIINLKIIHRTIDHFKFLFDIETVCVQNILNALEEEKEILHVEVIKY